MVETVLATVLTSAGASAATVAGVSSAVSTGFTLLSGLGAVAGVVGQVQGANQQARALKDQANQDILNSRMEKLKGEEQANKLRRDLIENMGSANAMFAARGIGLGSGTPEQAKEEGARNASLNIDKVMFGADMAATDQLTSASQNRAKAKATRSAGLYGAASSLADSKAIKSLVSL